jgi:short-chain fatty acids transporter
MSTEGTQASAIERLGYRVANVVERWMPSPFLFAIILTYIVYVAGLLATDSGPFELVQFWYDGFWLFLTFAMQMVLILMTGYVIAYHPKVNKGLQWLASIPSNGKTAVVMVGVVTMALGWIHWGISLIGGAILAREMGKVAHEKGINVHYPALAMSGYLGLGLTWHWGLSGSAPLLIATEGNAFMDQGVLGSVVPATETIFHPYALILTVTTIIAAAIVLYLLSPTGENTESITEYIPEEELLSGGDASEGEMEVGDELSLPENPVPADKIDYSRVLGGIIALTGVAFTIWMFVDQGLDALGLNVVNFGFLMIGLAIWTRPAYYRNRFGEASTAAAGIILLFPFFAGIQGIMASSGLAEMIANGLVDVASETTFPVIAWLIGSVVNLFVPSGGGEWIVVGPSVIEAAQQLGVPVGKATMSYAVGDAYTNLLNPFWALPLLAITQIKAREMMGYSVTMLLLMFPFFLVIFLVLPY